MRLSCRTSKQRNISTKLVVSSVFNRACNRGSPCAVYALPCTRPGFAAFPFVKVVFRSLQHLFINRQSVFLVCFRLPDLAEEGPAGKQALEHVTFWMMAMQQPPRRGCSGWI